MRSIAEARAEVARITQRSLADWAWSSALGTRNERMPLRISLGSPTEQDAFERLDAVMEWSTAWLARTGPGTVESVTRRWRSHGSQTLPHRLVLTTPLDAAVFAGLGPTWRAASSRVADLVSRWPEMRRPGAATMRRMVAVTASDWTRVLHFLEWATDRDLSEMLPRQIPIPGVDSKWFEKQRQLLESLRALSAGAGSLEVRDLDKRILVRVLDPQLRRVVGGLGDFDAAASELSRLQWQPSEVIICENAQCAFSFDDRPGAVLLAKQGYAVDVYGRIPWLRSAEVRYWGDIDTHGFAILDRLRHHLPSAISVLMDLQTLLDYQELWVREVSAIRHPLQMLTDEERDTYRALVDGGHGEHVRLEQERIPWAAVERAFTSDL